MGFNTEEIEQLLVNLNSIDQKLERMNNLKWLEIFSIMQNESDKKIREAIRKRLKELS